MTGWIITSLCLTAAAGLGLAGTIAYLAFLRRADNPPTKARAGGSDRRPLVVAAGDSLTQGSLGANWVAALRARPEHRGHEFLNAGINGNTAADLRRRVDTDVVACHPDAVTILIGTNDLRNGVPEAQYRDDLRAIVDRIKTRTSARIALMSMPPLGEDLNVEINRKVAAYNAVIKAVAAQAQVDYLPLHERMADLLRRRSGRTPYDFSFPLAFAVAARHYLFRRTWDEIAHAGGRELLIDDVHLSDQGGALVADITARWVAGRGTLRPPASSKGQGS